MVIIIIILTPAVTFTYYPQLWFTFCHSQSNSQTVKTKMLVTISLGSIKATQGGKVTPTKDGDLCTLLAGVLFGLKFKTGLNRL